MYADDTQVLLVSSNVDELVHKAQDELGNISEWMRLSKLSANPQKTEYMFIGHPNRTNKITQQEELKLNGSEIKRVKKVKSLGVNIDQGLNWEDQFKAIKGESMRALASLKTLKNIVSQSQLSNVYRALVESHIRYADVIWGSISNSKIESLQRFQDRAISIIDTSRIKDDWSMTLSTVKHPIIFD